MSGSDSPTFFHGQPWSNWIEKIGRDKPLSDDEPDSESSSAVMRLSADDIDLYGFCPERDAFYGVVCEICNSIVKPQALYRHMENRHPSGLTNLPPPSTSSSKIPLKTPYCKLSKLKKSQIPPSANNGNKPNAAIKKTGDQQSNLHSSISSSPRSPPSETLGIQASFTNALPSSSPVKSPNTNSTQKRKRLKTDRSSLKDREYDPDKHCGVWNEETGKPCTRSLTCKAHTVSLRRTVAGRSKTFDKLLAEHRASKESTNPKLPKVSLSGTITAIADTAISAATSNLSNEIEAPSSPPVLSLPDTYELPQVVDLLYQCLAPHGSNKPSKLEEDFATQLESGRIDSSMVNSATTTNSSMTPITMVLPSLSPVQSISPSSSILQYNSNISPPLTVEQLMSSKHSPTAPVVPVVPGNQSASVLEGKTPLDINNESITMYSPIYTDNKSQVTVQISRANLATHTSGIRSYQNQPSIKILNSFNEIDHSDIKNNQVSNGSRLNNHSGSSVQQMSHLKDVSQDYSIAIQVDAGSDASFENFNEITWSDCHPEPLAVNKWLRLPSNRKQYNFNIH